jgi:hypothetical protein
LGNRKFTFSCFRNLETRSYLHTLLYRSMKVDLSRPVPNRVNYLPSRLRRTSDQRLRYSLPREQSSETPSLFLRSNRQPAREFPPRWYSMSALVRAAALYVRLKNNCYRLFYQFGFLGMRELDIYLDVHGRNCDRSLMICY